MNCDLIIVGGGLVGASLALALKDSGLRIIILENQPANTNPINPEDGWDNRVYAISPANAEFLRQYGIWDTLPASRIIPIYAMQIAGDNNRSQLHFSAYEAGLPELAFITENRLLHQTILNYLKNVELCNLMPNVKCDTITQREDHIIIHLKDGRQIKTKLLIGADGMDSWVRKTSAIQATQRSYNQVGVVGNFKTELPHHNRAWQWFYQDHILAYLPLSKNQISIVWSVAEATGQELLGLPHISLAERVAEAGHYTLGKMELISPATAFPLNFLKVESSIAQRTALIGDAAHVIHPLAGQGVNLGLQDAKTLAQILTQRGVCSDCGDYSLLRRFARERKENILKMQLTTDTMQRLFNNKNPALGWLRNTGLNLTNHLPIIKNRLIQQALA